MCSERGWLSAAGTEAEHSHGTSCFYGVYLSRSIEFVTNTDFSGTSWNSRDQLLADLRGSLPGSESSAQVHFPAFPLSAHLDGFSNLSP